MKIADAWVVELDSEAAITRRVLTAVPEVRAAWRPHPKSFSTAELVLHHAGVLEWLAMTIERDEFDLSPPGAAPYVPPTATTIADAIASWDANLVRARAILAAASDESFARTWTLKKGGVVLFSMPRAVVLRTFVFSHLVHHRGQLSVYLRLLDVPVPAVYGPSADERF